MIRGLPYDAELEYLESTGTQWIDTGIKLRSTDTIDTRLYINSSSTEAWYGILGSRDSARYLILRCYVGKDYAVNALSPNHDYDFNRFTWGDLSFTFGGHYHESATNCYVFTYNNNGTGYTCLPYRIANFSITRDGSKLIDFIPVRVGTVGYMYDRVSKRLFGNAGTGDFVRGPDKSIPLMGLHFYPKPKPTARDYVQDGLVAMWDGIENAGWGVHDENATTWKDLIGGAEPTLTGGANVSWQANGCNVTSGYFTGSATQPVVDAFANEKVTIEVVCNPLNTNFGHMFSLTGAREEVWVARNSFPYLSYGSSSFTQYLSGGRHLNNLSSLSYAIDGANGTKYQDGILTVTDSNLVATVFPTLASQMRLCGSRAFAGLACAVRLYSRALTTAEIAANYAIDRERFNLP